MHSCQVRRGLPRPPVSASCFNFFLSLAIVFVWAFRPRKDPSYGPMSDWRINDDQPVRVFLTEKNLASLVTPLSDLSGREVVMHSASRLRPELGACKLHRWDVKVRHQ